MPAGRPATGRTPHVRTTLRLPPRLAEEIHQEAEDDVRGLNDHMIMLLHYGRRYRQLLKGTTPVLEDEFDWPE